MSRVVLWLAVACCFVAPAAGAATVTASLAASRTSGVAPLAVYFDATGTTYSTAIDRFSDLHYEWSFGDPNSGSWGPSGKSRNQAFGPVSAHVFETPGTYTVQLTVRDGAGAVSTRQVTINVSNPTNVFSGTSTICVSASGNFSGCPSGAQQVTNGSFNAALGYATAGKRVLLRRGDTYSSPSTYLHTATGPGIVGAYGSGNRPRITSNHSGDVLSTQNTDWRFMDLEFVGPNGTQYSQAIGGRLTRQLLLLRIEASLFHSTIGYSPATLPHFGQDFRQMQELYLVDSRIRDGRGGGGGNGVGIGFNKLVVLGSEVINMTQVEHAFRIFHATGGVLSHNRIGGASSTKLSLKIHALTWGGSLGQPTGMHTENLVISDNRFEPSSLQAFTMSLAPQNSQEDERIRNVLIERNHFTAGSSSTVGIFFIARSSTIRNNLFNLSGASNPTAVQQYKQGPEPTPENNQFHNNTCYLSTGSSSGARCMLIGSFANTRAYNNLIYAPNAGGGTAVNGSGDLRNNLVASSNPFVSSSPSAPADFQLRAGGPGVDAGYALLSNQRDFVLGVRPANGGSSNAWDVGAFERGASGSTPPPTPRLDPPVLQ